MEYYWILTLINAFKNKYFTDKCFGNITYYNAKKFTAHDNIKELENLNKNKHLIFSNLKYFMAYFPIISCILFCHKYPEK